MVAMASQISESQLVLFNGGDHPLMWTRAARFRRVADNFLAGLEQAPCDDDGASYSGDVPRAVFSARGEV
jgi:hypothetical protein